MVIVLKARIFVGSPFGQLGVLLATGLLLGGLCVLLPDRLPVLLAGVSSLVFPITIDFVLRIKRIMVG